MIEFIDIRKMKLFNIILFGYIGFSIPIGIFLGFLTLIRLMPVNVNGMELYGITGFIFQLIFMPICALLLTIPTWAILSTGLIILKACKKAFSKEEN